MHFGQILPAADAIKGKPEPPPATPTPGVPPWWGKLNVGPPEQWGQRIPEPAPQSAPPPAVPQTGPSLPQEGSTIPRTLSGEGVLNQALTSLDNKTLGTADARIIKKIIDDFSHDELQNVRDTGLEISRHGPAPNNYATPKLAADAWHLKVLQTFLSRCET